MDTMSVTVTPTRPGTSIAGARESARHFLEDSYRSSRPRPPKP